VAQSVKVREITVSIFSDFSFRQRTDWLKGLPHRFDVVNRIYAPSTKVQWRIVSDDLAIPTAYAELDDRRLVLKDRTDERVDVLLIYTVFADAPAPAASTLSHTRRWWWISRTNPMRRMRFAWLTN